MEQRFEEVLKEVNDPELGVNIIDLGLIYGLEKKGDQVGVEMTMTTPACPYASELIERTRKAIMALEGINDCKIKLTFKPLWTTKRMSEEAKFKLGIVD